MCVIKNLNYTALSNKRIFGMHTWTNYQIFVPLKSQSSSSKGVTELRQKLQSKVACILISVKKKSRPHLKASNHFSGLLIRNLLRLCEAKFPKEAARSVIAGRTELRMNVEREGFHVQFQLSPIVTILSKHLLPPPIPNTSATKGLEVPDITPFNSVLNFEEEHFYEAEDYMGI